MRERLRLVGGTITIESAMREGTKVEVNVGLGGVGSAMSLRGATGGRPSHASKEALALYRGRRY
jgi:hypothetical protein